VVKMAKAVGAMVFVDAVHYAPTPPSTSKLSTSTFGLLTLQILCSP
jgi:hypothetical protein